MKSQSLPGLERAVNVVAIGLRALRNQIRLLVGLFPRLRDAFDADELPVSFILERGSRRFEGGHGGHGHPIAAKALLRQRPERRWVERRSTQNKQASDE